ncbi:hypothetical protein HDU97_005282 [Phlyctochytrium planicorne]|nr:hypothetical protein HDU97_005282 [Phlyctochytrium planicorne]
MALKRSTTQYLKSEKTTLSISPEENQLWELHEKQVYEFVSRTHTQLRPALRYLAAKDFDVDKAVHLFEECKRASEEPAHLTLSSQPLWQNLSTPIFILTDNATDKNGAGIMMLNMRFWDSEEEGMTRMHWLLRFLVDQAVEVPNNVVNGITLVSNVDSAPTTVGLSEAHETVLELFLYTAPIKLNRILVVNAPWYWSYSIFGSTPAEVPVLSCTPETLLNYIPKESLVEDLGGDLVYDHEEWVKQTLVVSIKFGKCHQLRLNDWQAIEKKKEPEQSLVVATKPPIPSRATSLALIGRTTPTPSPEPVQVTFRSQAEIKIENSEKVEIWERTVTEDAETRNVSLSRSVHPKSPSPHNLPSTLVELPPMFSPRRSKSHRSFSVGPGVSTEPWPVDPNAGRVIPIRRSSWTAEDAAKSRLQQRKPVQPLDFIPESRVAKWNAAASIPASSSTSGFRPPQQYIAPSPAAPPAPTSAPASEPVLTTPQPIPTETTSPITSPNNDDDLEDVDIDISSALKRKSTMEIRQRARRIREPGDNGWGKDSSKAPPFVPHVPDDDEPPLVTIPLNDPPSAQPPPPPPQPTSAQFPAAGRYGSTFSSAAPTISSNAFIESGDAAFTASPFAPKRASLTPPARTTTLSAPPRRHKPRSILKRPGEKKMKITPRGASLTDGTPLPVRKQSLANEKKKVKFAPTKEVIEFERYDSNDEYSSGSEEESLPVAKPVPIQAPLTPPPTAPLPIPATPPVARPRGESRDILARRATLQNTPSTSTPASATSPPSVTPTPIPPARSPITSPSPTFASLPDIPKPVIEKSGGIDLTKLPKRSGSLIPPPEPVADVETKEATAISLSVPKIEEEEVAVQMEEMPVSGGTVSPIEVEVLAGLEQGQDDDVDVVSEPARAEKDHSEIQAAEAAHIVEITQSLPPAVISPSKELPTEAPSTEPPESSVTEYGKNEVLPVKIDETVEIEALAIAVASKEIDVQLPTELEESPTVADDAALPALSEPKETVASPEADKEETIEVSEDDKTVVSDTDSSQPFGDSLNQGVILVEEAKVAEIVKKEPVVMLETPPNSDHELSPVSTKLDDVKELDVAESPVDKLVESESAQDSSVPKAEITARQSSDQIPTEAVSISDSVVREAKSPEREASPVDITNDEVPSRAASEIPAEPEFAAYVETDVLVVPAPAEANAPVPDSVEAEVPKSAEVAIVAADILISAENQAPCIEDIDNQVHAQDSLSLEMSADEPISSAVLSEQLISETVTEIQKVETDATVLPKESEVLAIELSSDRETALVSPPVIASEDMAVQVIDETKVDSEVAGVTPIANEHEETEAAAIVGDEVVFKEESETATTAGPIREEAVNVEVLQVEFVEAPPAADAPLPEIPMEVQEIPGPDPILAPEEKIGSPEKTSPTKESTSPLTQAVIPSEPRPKPGEFAIPAFHVNDKPQMVAPVRPSVLVKRRTTVTTALPVPTEQEKLKEAEAEREVQSDTNLLEPPMWRSKLQEEEEKVKELEKAEKDNLATEPSHNFSPQVMELINKMPKPVAAPRSSRTAKVSEVSLTVPIEPTSTAPDVSKEINDGAVPEMVAPEVPENEALAAAPIVAPPRSATLKQKSPTSPEATPGPIPMPRSQKTLSSGSQQPSNGISSEDLMHEQSTTEESQLATSPEATPGPVPMPRSQRTLNRGSQQPASAEEVAAEHPKNVESQSPPPEQRVPEEVSGPIPAPRSQRTLNRGSKQPEASSVIAETVVGQTAVDASLGPIPAPRSQRTLNRGSKDATEEATAAEEIPKGVVDEPVSSTPIPSPRSQKTRDRGSTEVAKVAGNVPKAVIDEPVNAAPIPAPRSQRTLNRGSKEVAQEATTTGEVLKATVDESVEVLISETVVKKNSTVPIPAPRSQRALNRGTQQAADSEEAKEMVLDQPLVAPPRSSKTLSRGSKETSAETSPAEPAPAEESIPAAQPDEQIKASKLVPFEQVLSVLQDLPKPVPAPRSRKTLRDEKPASEVQKPEESLLAVQNGVQVMQEEPKALPEVLPQDAPVTVESVAVVEEPTAPSKLVPFDQVLSVLKELPKPVPAPRSRKTLAKEEDLTATVTENEQTFDAPQPDISPKESHMSENGPIPRSTISAGPEMDASGQPIPAPRSGPIPAPRSAATLKRNGAHAEELPDPAAVSEAVINETLDPLPAPRNGPVPAPRSAQTINRHNGVSELASHSNGLEKSAEPNVQPTEELVPAPRTGPVPAPRSARTLKRATESGDQENFAAPTSAATSPTTPEVYQTSETFEQGPVPAPRSARTLKGISPAEDNEPSVDSSGFPLLTPPTRSPPNGTADTNGMPVPAPRGTRPTPAGEQETSSGPVPMPRNARPPPSAEAIQDLVPAPRSSRPTAAPSDSSNAPIPAPRSSRTLNRTSQPNGSEPSDERAAEVPEQPRPSGPVPAPRSARTMKPKGVS